MLLELHVADFGVISRTHLVLGAGMTVLTGETGAGKTMLIGAIDLLTGGRSDPKTVRPGADQAVVEGRFVRPDETEVILSRVVPSSGRSRAYIDGRLATAAALAELGADLVDLHGQHAHQSLLAGAIQRQALDAFGEIDLRSLVESKAELAALEAALVDLGGDPRERAREIDLYRYQVEELQGAGLLEPTEEALLAEREDLLADATAHREAGAEALAAVDGDAAAIVALSGALQALAERIPFRAEHERLAGLLAELDDLRGALRATTEALEDDPAQLADVRARRQLLRELMRKYGSDLGEVIAYQATAESRLDDLTTHDQRAAELDRRRAVAATTLAAAEKQVAKARRAAAPKLASAVENHLHELAMPKARFDVAVDGPGGEQVVFGLAANPGAPVLPLAKVASGGELARSMLAFRQVLTGAPATLVFDEVDAGIGGEVAHAVGRSLARLADRHQVLVVTHLAQVAAFADQQVQVRKSDDGTTTSTTFEPLSAEQRVVELSRMLSGSPDSTVAQAHAEELLAAAGRGETGQL